MRIAVLSGGRSSEREISKLSGAAVATGLTQAGHEVVAIEITAEGEWTCAGESVGIRPGKGLTLGQDPLAVDVVFPVLHGPFGEDGVTQGALETARLPYVGSDVLGSAVCMDKLSLKRLCASHGIPQVGFVQAFTADWQEQALELEFPLWVKPSRLGSSVGIHKVTDPAHLAEAVEEAAKFDPRVIIEANCGGREVECSVLGNDRPEASLPGEILTDDDWYDFEAKYTEGHMRLAVPAEIGEDATGRLRELSLKVFQLAGCAGLARCDFFVEDDGPGPANILLNEINTIPGFTPLSVYAKLWEATGLAYPDLCDRLVSLAIDRHRAEASHSF